MEQIGESFVQELFDRHEGTTRQTILTLLKTKGHMNANELAKELQITEMAVRRHLNTLERDGFIHLTLVRQAMGRPTHMFGLTELAEQHFPKRYSVLALDLLDELNDDELVDQLFERRKAKLLRSYASRMEGKQL